MSQVHQTKVASVHADLESEDTPRFKFVDLFSGLGGFHVALRRMGGQAVFAAEWVPDLADLYERNFGLRPAGDITKVSMEDIPDHDVLTAGFPCQPFSKAGEQLGFEHTEQGQLFFHVAGILEAKRPQYFILENVPNILKHRQGATIRRIREDLAALGYDVRISKLSPHQFGVPQIRERVYIVGSLSSLDDFVWPEPNHEPTSIRSVLDNSPSDARPLGKITLDCLRVWDDFLRAVPDSVELPSFPLWAMEFGADYPYEVETPFAMSQRLGSRGLAQFAGAFGESLHGLQVEDQLAIIPSYSRRRDGVFPKWKVDFIRQNRKFYEDNQGWIDPWLPKIRSFPASMQKLEWNVKGGEKSIWNYVIQTRASGVRLKRPTTAPSLVAMTDTQVPIIAWEKRYMSPRECSRLQSLETIELPGSRRAAYKALGNAVNAKVVEEVASAMMAWEIRQPVRYNETPADIIAA
jgi:DNA (cytosine-5)-methyltransferase 1